MYQYKDLRTILKRAKKDLLQQPVRALEKYEQTEKQQKLETWNEKKNDCMDS